MSDIEPIAPDRTVEWLRSKAAHLESLYAYNCSMESNPRPEDVAALRAAADEIVRLRGEIAALPELWECPDCAFTFDAAHENTDGSGYSCPVCEVAALQERTTPPEPFSTEFVLMLVDWYESPESDCQDTPTADLLRHAYLPSVSGEPTPESETP